MAKTRKSNSETVSSKTVQKTKAPVAGNRNFLLLGAGLAAAIITALVFSGVTSLEWTNWDDDEYVYENKLVQNGDTKGMFTQPINNTYTPLVLLTYSWEWAKAKDDPKIYHTTNLVLHVACTFLVYRLMLLLGLNMTWAVIAALMFGIHPLKVESVAWVTERKDVLFGLFFIGGLVAYLNYLKEEKIPWLALTLLLFGLSLFSKIQATTFPLSIVAIDWYRQRKLNFKLIAEKIPFFAGAFAMGLWGLYILKEGESLDVNQTFPIYQRFALGMYAFCTYLIKFIIPYETCTYYPYPKEVSAIHYLSLVAVIGLGGLLFFLRKKSRPLVFGMMFFIFNIMFLLQILGAGVAYQADRFTYVAYIGLIFSTAMMLQQLTESKKNLLPVVAGISVVWCSIFGLLTAKYIPVWQNSETLWDDVIEKYPRKIVIAYVNRGHYLRRMKRNEEALKDFNTAIELKKDYYLAYLNRGNIYFDRGDDDKALADYTKTIELYAKSAGTFSNRGAIYARKKMIKEALADFDKAIALDKNEVNTYRNRGVVYTMMGEDAKAAQDYGTFLKLQPNDPNITNDKGVAYLRMKKYDEALVDFNKAIVLQPNNPSFVLNRGYAWYYKGDYTKAYADVTDAQKLGAKVDPAFLNQVTVMYNQNKNQAPPSN